MTSTQHTGVGSLTPSEIAYLAESEPITIVPRQRLDGLDLISGYIPPFRPPQRTSLPIWLALDLKRQRRCSIVPPVWLTSSHIDTTLTWELEHPTAFSTSLPWRWLEIAELLLEAASDDIPDASLGGEKDLRVLLRGLREVRQTKAREGLKQLESTYLQMNGLGAMEITELRGFAGAVVDGLRRLGAGEIREGEEGGEGGEGSDDEMEDVESVSARTTTVRGASTVGGGGGSGGASSVAGRSGAGVRGSSVAGPGSSRMGSSVPPHYEYEDLE